MTYNGAAAPQRKSTFEYYASGGLRGLLWKETIEPGSAYALTTEHSYDTWG